MRVWILQDNATDRLVGVYTTERLAAANAEYVYGDNWVSEIELYAVEVTGSRQYKNSPR